MMKLQADPIENPPHYTFSRIEVIDAIEAWELGFHLGNVVKYVAARAGREPGWTTFGKLDGTSIARSHGSRNEQPESANASLPQVPQAVFLDWAGQPYLQDVPSRQLVPLRPDSR